MLLRQAARNDRTARLLLAAPVVELLNGDTETKNASIEGKLGGKDWSVDGSASIGQNGYNLKLNSTTIFKGFYYDITVSSTTEFTPGSIKSTQTLMGSDILLPFFDWSVRPGASATEETDKKTSFAGNIEFTLGGLGKVEVIIPTDKEPGVMWKKPVYVQEMIDFLDDPLGLREKPHTTKHKNAC